MSYTSPYTTFIFEKYSFDKTTATASFEYSFDHRRRFIEKIVFEKTTGFDAAVLEKVVWLAYLLAGTSYYKCFPTRDISFGDYPVTPLDVELLDAVYRDGLSQFVFENHLTPDMLPEFHATTHDIEPISYDRRGTLVLQSGGKDSLLLAELLKNNSHHFETVYMSSGDSYPHVIYDIQQRPPRLMRRIIDREALTTAKADDALNGHVPVTFIAYAYALIDAVLHREHMVLAAVGREGGEAHEFIGDFAINHQWSKTWEAEQLLARYVSNRIAPELSVGSPLRAYSELRIAELFVQHAWAKYGHSFSSCNLANYAQGQSNDKLKWCGECPKCANSFLLFAPFVEPHELASLFAGENLFEKPSLADTFKGLLGIDGVMKPFECVGETGELRLAYQMARERYGSDIYSLPFAVPESNFDYRAPGPAQISLTTFISF